MEKLDTMDNSAFTRSCDDVLGAGGIRNDVIVNLAGEERSREAETCFDRLLSPGERLGNETVRIKNRVCIQCASVPFHFTSESQKCPFPQVSLCLYMCSMQN